MTEINPQNPEENTEELEEKKRKKKAARRAVLAIVVVVLIAVGIYCGMSYKYNNVFFNNTTINGVDCSGLTIEEANEKVIALEDGYSIKLQFRGRVYEIIDGSQIGYGHDATQEIEELFHSQVPVMWFRSSKTHYDYTVEPVDFYDREMLDDVLRTLPEVQKKNMKPPVDAVVSLEEDTFVIKPEEEGCEIDVDKMVEDITNEVDARSTFYSVMRSDVYKKPDVYKNDKKLIAKADELNGIIKAEITYQIPGAEDIVLDRKTLVEWLSKDKDGNYYKDEEVWNNHISEFVEKISEAVANAPAVWEFDTTGRGTITLNFGTYPRETDFEAEEALLKEELEKGEVIARSPYMLIGDKTQKNHGIGSTYIEADLSRQHVWVYENGAVIMEFDVISGRPEHKYVTPDGVFNVASKCTNRRLLGPQRSDGSYEWDSFVNFWMPFYDGCGFHDASWQDAFGGSWWLSRGSHGCINLSYSVAQTLYSWIEPYVPVVIYYSEPIPFRD